ncbi:hypothetical protein SporoP37_03205 [Sporosarcina sp. P37]|uniref:DUF84 family protein n=1 Tax=unclassified Sporosarcina TaxID=2647733 RepID=UPI000A179E33|nr:MULTISPECIES: DUF84 family protein [unclassified Sporosarcina]ARK23802.1 hypothetical protein SporoP37_03205 [Sporosarcina sp. P37]PID18948.1 inosine/xanthosine triphosphatase [Sporosarcina sp. P35]
MKFVLGSKNQAKKRAAVRVIEHCMENSTISSVSVPSGVSDQPMSDAETRRGAINRAMAAAQGAYGIGLEGGVHMLEGVMYLCNWGALATPEGEVYTAAGAQIPLPEELADEIRNGKELGDAVDRYFNKKQIRMSEGAMGMLTAQLVPRDALFEHIMRLLIGQLLYRHRSTPADCNSGSMRLE